MERDCAGRGGKTLLAALILGLGSSFSAMAYPVPQAELRAGGARAVLPVFDRFQRPQTQEVQMAESASELDGEPWTIISAAGQAEPGNPPPRLIFSAGRLRFSGPCNSYETGFSLAGDDLTFMPFPEMPKVCAPEVMARETALLRILSRVTGYGIEAPGVLVLKSLQNEVLRAER